MRGWPQPRARRVARCESTAVPGGDMQALGTQGTAHAALPCTHTGPGRSVAHKRDPFPRAGELPGDGPERGREGARESVRGGRVRGRTSRKCAGASLLRNGYLLLSRQRAGARASCRAARHDGNTPSRPQARSSAGHARMPAPHGLACARQTYRWVPGRARERPDERRLPGLTRDPGRLAVAGALANHRCGSQIGVRR